MLGFAYGAPVQGQFSSGFGLRTDPLAGGSRFHYGLDIAAEEGAVVSSFADGVVTAGWGEQRAGPVCHCVPSQRLFHTVRPLYSHHRLLRQQVWRAETPSPEVGETGRATGPHLHFELHHGSTYLNPVYYVPFQ